MSGISSSTCEELEAGIETTYENGTAKQTFLKGPAVSWWAAENWCKAHHKNLVSYSTLNSLFDCNKTTYSCTWNKLTTSSYWNNGAIVDYYWTAESYDSRSAWAVLINSYGNQFYYNERRFDWSYSALCE